MAPSQTEVTGAFPPPQSNDREHELLQASPLQGPGATRLAAVLCAFIQDADIAMLQINYISTLFISFDRLPILRDSF